MLYYQILVNIILHVNILKKIYRVRLERLRLLREQGTPEDDRWLIEAKVRLAGELPDSFSKHMPGLGKSTFAKK